jgi:ribosomal protein S18 acetylase RimI-like enzyme
MADLTTRGYQAADAAALTDLFNLTEQVAGGHPGYTADETRALVGALIDDPERDSRLLVDPSGELVAAGLVPTPPPGGFRVDLFGAVHPDRRGQGIGRDLLGWQLARAAEIHRATAPQAQWQAETGAVVGDDSADRLMARMGLTPVRYFFEMLAPTKQTELVPLPDGLHSRPYQPELARSLYEAHMETFSDHWGYQKREYEPWLSITVRSANFRPDLSRIAFAGNEIAGYVLGYDNASADRVYIGQVGTRRPWRRRGLAGKLLTEVLSAAAGADKKLAALAVDADSPTGAVGVYQRVGFNLEYRAVAYRRPLA